MRERIVAMVDHGFSNAEIAGITGVPRGTIYNIRNRRKK